MKLSERLKAQGVSIIPSHREEIEQLATQAMPSESEMIRKLHAIFGKQSQGEYGLTQNTGSQFSSFDAELVKTDIKSRISIILAKIELESTPTEKDWDDKMRDRGRWPRGLSIPARKIDRALKECLGFLKYSVTMRSGWMGNSAHILSGVQSGLYKTEYDPKCGMTKNNPDNNVFLSIPFRLFERHQDNFLVIENDDWSQVLPTLLKWILNK